MHKAINEDGTGVYIPKNPLEEKWKKEYPMMCNCKKVNEDESIHYACASCGDCPKGSYFKVSKEEMEIYRKYLEDCVKYFSDHNPSMNKPKTYTKKYDRI